MPTHAVITRVAAILQSGTGGVLRCRRVSVKQQDRSIRRLAPAV
eukprot:COSAG06_NODE_32085_length_511_cov_1.400485_2_plen_43_part_01